MAGEKLFIIEQKYRKGVPFATYTLANGLSNWVWEGRTLSGLRDEDGNFFPADGREITLTGNGASLSAVWTLNRLPLSVYLIGENGEENGVSVKITQTSNPRWRMDTSNSNSAWEDSQRPENYYSFDNTISQTSSVNVPYNGCISIDIMPAEDTNIEAVFYSGIDYGRDTRHIEQSNRGDYYIIAKSLSVTYTKKGILRYLPNQD